MTDARDVLTRLYQDVVHALHPAPRVQAALDAQCITTPGAVSLIAIGKAAGAMIEGALAWCDGRRIRIHGALSISHASTPHPNARVDTLLGDHPVPGAHSEAAASEIAQFIGQYVTPDIPVLVLLSGGASALIGAPRDGMSAQEYRAQNAALLGSGLDITGMNAVRRRMARWAGGRLGIALQARGADVRVLVISDVMGDDLASIGSGPCIPDAGSDAPPIPHLVISSNRVALDTLARVAANCATPIHAEIASEPLQGDAHRCGELIAQQVLHASHATAHTRTGATAHLMCWGGEPTVALPQDAPPGGRMQSLALQVARALHEAGASASGITVLAAGTDGRDGATDAAGAVVDANTWSAAVQAGRDPAADLAQFRSHDALRAANCLIPSFASGTNVNDLVIALITRA